MHYPLTYFLDTTVELGVSAVELWAAAPHLCLDVIDDAGLRQAGREVRSRGLRVCCLTPEQCTYPVNLAAEDEALRRHSIQNFRRAIQAAQELECPMVLVTAGCGYYNRPVSEAWERAADSLGQIAAYGLDQGVRLVLETLTPISSNVLNTPEQQRDMLARLPQGSACGMVDIGQMAYMGHDLSRYLALGDGDLSLADYLVRIEAAGYTGMYGMEFNDIWYRRDPRSADRQSLAWLEDHHIFAE